LETHKTPLGIDQLEGSWERGEVPFNLPIIVPERLTRGQEENFVFLERATSKASVQPKTIPTLEVTKSP